MRTKILTIAIATVFLAACGWFVRAAGPERKFAQGLAHLRANQPEETLYCLEAIEHRSGYQAQSSLLRGWLRLQSQQSHDAEEYIAIWADLSDALDVRKCRPLTLALMGRLLYEGGRYANALSVLQSALAEDPDEIEVHRWLGSALYDLGAMAPAVDHLKRVADQETANSRICRLLGLIYRDRGAFREAAAAYQESLTRDPRQTDADQVRCDLARCQIALEDYDAALTVLQGCADNDDVLALRGLCYFHEGNRERAKQCVDRSLQENAENVAALNCLAMLDPAAAVQPLAKAVEDNPDDYQLRERLATVYRAVGKDDLAAKQEQRLAPSRALRKQLNTLLTQANDNLFDPALRYQIADVAQQLGLTKLSNDWLKAARLLESSNAAAVPMPVLATPPGRR
ncbi:MAG TPA: tetratricopeptide repeat protein [Pirellulales bacterium]